MAIPVKQRDGVGLMRDAVLGSLRLPPKVFISYSHDSLAHAARVRKLANDLHRDGVYVIIDQDVASPPEGWPLWCQQQIEAADFVLMVCTKSYHHRVKGDEQPGTGLGVVWEASIIRNLLYDAGAVSNKFVPVLFSASSVKHIPTVIKGRTWHVVNTKNGYERLLRQLRGQPEPRSAGSGTYASPPHSPASVVAQAGGGSSYGNGLPLMPADSKLTRWHLRIEGTVEDINPIIQQLTYILRQISEDASLSIESISPGSVILELECSNKAGLRLRALISNGTLRELLGHRVHSITPAERNNWWQRLLDKNWWQRLLGT